MSDPWGQSQPQQPQQPGGDWSVPPSNAQSGGFNPPPADVSGQYGAQPPAYGYPVAPPQQGSNGMAIAGFVLAFFCTPLGLIFSILGLRNAKNAGGKGRGLALAGIVISIAAMIIGVAVVIFGMKAASNSTALDPGCTSAESKITTLDSSLTADESNPDALVTDLQNIHTVLVSAEGQATHDSVKTKLQAFDTDVQNFITDYQAVKAGSSSDTTKLSTDASQLSTDGNAVDTVCSTL